MASTDLVPTPTLLNDRYQVVRILEDCPWSTAWLAEDTHLPSRRQCIIRQVKPLTTDADIQTQLCDRIRAEIDTWQKLGGIHDQIPWVSSFTDTQGQIYLIEEWVPGLTLTQAIQAKGALDEVKVRDILAKLLSLVDYLHQNQVVHCALEPSSILLRQADHKPVLQYGGMLNRVIANTLLAHNIQPIPWISISGFFPHEQVVLDRYSSSNNLYSLGLIGIYLLTGKHPYHMFNLTTETYEWHQETLLTNSAFAAILNKAIAPCPSERFVTASQMLAAGAISATVPHCLLYSDTADECLSTFLLTEFEPLRSRKSSPILFWVKTT